LRGNRGDEEKRGERELWEKICRTPLEHGLEKEEKGGGRGGREWWERRAALTRGLPCEERGEKKEEEMNAGRE
jgi:hypothetical protein